MLESAGKFGIAKPVTGLTRDIRGSLGANYSRVILNARHIIIIPVDIIIMNFSRIVFRHLLMPELCLKSAHSWLESAHSWLKSVYCLRKIIIQNSSGLLCASERQYRGVQTALSELVCNVL